MQTWSKRRKPSVLILELKHKAHKTFKIEMRNFHLLISIVMEPALLWELLNFSKIALLSFNKWLNSKNKECWAVEASWETIVKQIDMLQSVELTMAVSLPQNGPIKQRIRHKLDSLAAEVLVRLPSQDLHLPRQTTMKINTPRCYHGEPTIKAS